jgi:hypothetical protein
MPRLFCSAACGLALLATLVTASRPVSAAAEPTVVAVVAVDGYADLKKQVRWLGTQVGNPALDGFAESFIMMATQFKGLAGLDVARPAGIVVTVADGVPAVQGCVPVKDLDRLLAALEGVIGPADRDGDVRRLVPPGGMPLDVTERGGWAFFAPRGMPVAVADPAAILGPLLESFTLAVEVFPARMPVDLRNQLEAAVEQAARVAAAQQGQPVDDEAVRAAFAGLADTESFTLGLRLDPEAGRMLVEGRTVLVPGSPATAVWAAAGAAQATVADATTSDGKPAAVRGHFVQAIPAAARATFERTMTDAVARAAPDAGGDPVGRSVLGLLADLGAAMLDAGGVDARVGLDTSAADADRPLPNLTLGMRVKDGASLERRLKDRLGKPGVLPAGVTAAFDTGKAGAATLHEITLAMQDVPEAERFGGKVVLTLAIAPEYAFLMAGEGIPGRLEAALGGSGRPDATAEPITGLDLSLAALASYAARLAGAFNPGAEENAALDTMARTAAAEPTALVQLLARPIDRGLALRLSADAGAIRTIAAGVSAQQAGGPGVPRPAGGRPPGKAIPLPGLAP